MRQVNQAIDQTGHAGLVHGNGHKFSGLKIQKFESGSSFFKKALYKSRPISGAIRQVLVVEVVFGVVQQNTV